ncbi:MAG: VWA domain-containing protein [Muribaculaceae bacterium]|nr:VWA domain-containing protein [Muribaculaceae bacterium]
MNNTLKIILFAVAFFTVIALGIFGLTKIKLDDFHKAAVIFIVDSSASNAKDLPAQKMLIRQLCSMLDPEDHIKILRVSENSYLFYEGSPQGSDLRKAMEKYTQLDSKEYGTAYGQAFKKAFNHAITMSSGEDGYIPAVVVIGDLENEGAVEKQIDWDELPSEVMNVQNKSQDFAMMFLYASPEKLDYVKEKLGPVLGEKKLILGNEVTTNKSLRRFLNAIGR